MYYRHIAIALGANERAIDAIKGGQSGLVEIKDVVPLAILLKKN